ncbi:hypothetical protein NPIL_334771 [Nephila pilipes]|uniref:Uncharacterized protein n=1 Tax=Nephila pilipes TaxID=299642 RepID=A0A8X6QJM0_NEPPI|nr:hypothetical protein NPIL_334771 [Nephila pilipes]
MSAEREDIDASLSGIVRSAVSLQISTILNRNNGHSTVNLCEKNRKDEQQVVGESTASASAKEDLPPPPSISGSPLKSALREPPGRISIFWRENETLRGRHGITEHWLGRKWNHPSRYDSSIRVWLCLKFVK